jgi:immune inhibitor A
MKNATHTFKSYGTYNVTLTAVDDTLQKFVFTKVVVIENALASSFTLAKSYLKVTFTSTITGGDEKYTYEWNFGDDTAVSTEANPVHTYAKAGSYTIALKVTDGTGVSVTTEQTVVVAAEVVTPPPVTPPTKKSGGSGGGSFGLWLLDLAGTSLVRKKVK